MADPKDPGAGDPWVLSFGALNRQLKAAGISTLSADVAEAPFVASAY